MTAALAALAAAHVVDGLRARRRLAAMPVLPVGSPAQAGAGDELAAGLVAFTPEASSVDGGLLAVAAAYADRTATDVVDLVPDGLGSEALLAVARRTPADRAPGAGPTAPAGAGYALLLRPALVERLGHPTADRTRLGRGPHALAGLSRAAGRTATGARSTVVAPGLTPPTGSSGPDAWARLDALTQLGRPYTSLAAMAVAARAAHLAALAGGLLVSPVAGAAALAAWWAKPALATAGRAPDALAATARRPLAQVGDLAGLARAGHAASRADAARRASGPAWPVPSTAEAFGPRRTTCPWCRSPDLAVRLTTTDLLQHKPGRFVLDECRACGHVFQNPQLSPAGLDFYYDQFYDGIGGELMTQLFGTAGPDNARRIAAVDAAAEATGTRVQRWLDVGTGHGHFPLAARARWPDVRFEGLDLSESVNDAARRGWVDVAHRGLFPELAPVLGGFDVVSMHHYLEHTRDPVEEIDAVAKLLDGGALLEVEVPDPECRMSRLLGRWWLPWLQPQHLHFVTAANLVAALEERNFEIVSVQHDHQATELTGALALLLEDVLPSSQFPWRPPGSPARQLARGALMTASLPAFAVAAGVDQLVARALTGDGPANTYRVVARKL